MSGFRFLDPDEEKEFTALIERAARENIECEIHGDTFVFKEKPLPPGGPFVNHPGPSRPVLGFREWVTKDGELHPINDNGSAWEPGRNIAACWQGGKSSPCPTPKSEITRLFGGGCHCGFNAWFEKEEILQSHIAYEDSISGAIAGVGKLEIHRRGFRAEQAQILGLVYPKGCLAKPKRFAWIENRRLKKKRKRIDVLAKKYEVPVFDSIEALYDFAKDYATPVRSSDVQIFKLINWQV